MADTIIGKIRAIITADSSGLDKATDRAEKSLKDLGNQAKKTGAETSVAMKQMAGTLATAFATAKLTAFVKSSVSGASDLAEAMNVTREIFGSASDEIITFSKTASRSLGQSQKVALDGANTFATFGKSAGLAGTDLSNFAIQFSGLASDLASFRNTTPEDAIMAIGAALRGETEPIRRYGVLLNDMSLRQEALAMGLVKTTKEALNPQNKVLAAGSLIMKQTADAQGDFARTSDGLANSSRILAANVEDLKAGMGEALLPAAESIVAVLNPMIVGFNSLGESSKKLLSTVGLLGAGLIIARRALASFGIELKTAEGKATFLGKSLGLIGKGLATIAIAEGVNATINSITDNAGNLERKLQAVVIAGEQGAGALTDAFAALAAAEGKGLSLGNIIADFGKEFAIAGEGGKRNVEEIDRAFKKVLELSPSLAQQLIDDWLAQTSALDQNSSAYRDNVNEIAKYQEWVDLATGSTDVLKDAIAETEPPLQTAEDAFAGVVEQLEDYRRLVLGVATVTKRELTVATNDTISATRDFLEATSEGKMTTQDFENALIEQAESLIALQFATKGEVGALKQVTPAMRYVIESMYRAAEAQGRTRVETNKLIRELGLLDGIDPQIAIMLTMDVSQVKAQIEQIKKGIEVAKRIGNFQMLAGLTRELEALVALGDAISGAGDFTFSPGGGGGGGGAEDPFAWVGDWVSSIADTANELISRNFAKDLVSGSADDIREAFANLLEVAADLNLGSLPGFEALLGSVTAQFEKLATTVDRRDLLTEQIDDATDALKTLQSQIEDIQQAQEDWLVSTQQKSPTLSLIEQALEAQREYERLYSNAEELRQQRQSFAGEIASSVMSPLQAGKSALGQTSRVLADARKFRDNILALRERGFGGDVLREVVNAGVVDGNRIAKSLLSMSEADMATFAQMRQEIAAIGAETGAFVADVVFGADVSEAERKLDEQRNLVNQLFANALAEAEKNAKRQEVVVGKLNDKLAGTEAAIRDLTYAIQVDLYNAFFGFLAGFQNGLDQIGRAPGRVPALATGGVVTRPTVALVGESGAEAVIPLDRMGSMGGGDVYVTLVVEGSVTSERDLVETIRKGLLSAQKSGRQVLL